ncbi:uncharacterized protein Z520_11858 [Fonsecaea multimorphosa CBS 102226]|uniref:Transcription factor domain-containing protein n=1 Tax=Fonsecaea multimorphosa CBS 102226 TaxID=1442371 RepID=A0A0D2JPK6_9EURO|nr:uncharacterized protein Z520_11858 [Fonsecaea multimorphosa CBS 102226]KIX92384.1 hypothetical protein Z520_11858 [Fonsecaea multimorphosa CBS 102226]
MQAVLDALKFGSREEANQTLEHLRSTAQNAPQADAGADDDNDPGDFEQGLPRLEESSLEMMLLDTGGRQKCKAASSTTTTTTDVPGWIPASFSPKTLPSEQMVRMGSTFYFEVISGLFYVTASENFDSLLDAVYRAEAEPEMTDIAEICAVASVGAHFHPDGVQDELKDALFRTAIQNINELIEVSGVRAIGVLACLSIYGLLEKRRSTRGLIHLGLQLARWEQQEVGGSPSLLLIRKKLHRTMVFLECWLSTSLGYYPGEFQLSDVEVEPLLRPLDENDMSDLTQTKMCQVGWLKARVVRAVFTRPFPGFPAIESLMVDLNTWPQQLPLHMTLKSLIENKDNTPHPLTAAHNGALFLAHAMYLGAEIFLYRPILIAMADQKAGRSWPLPSITAEQAARCYTRCVEAARTIARLFSLLRIGTSETMMHNRCWLTNFEIFTACSVLLYDLAERSLSPLQQETEVQAELQRAGECLTMLKASACADRVSQRLHDTLNETYQKVKMLNDKPSERTQVQNGDETDRSGRCGYANGKESLAVAQEALKAMTNILKDPFGHGDKEGLILDFSIMGADTVDWFSSCET